MSYILEALKKSQLERERGQVPRLQAPAIDDPPEPTQPPRWAVAAIGLAAVAVLMAAYAALRPGPPAPTVDASGAAQEQALAAEPQPVGERQAANTQAAGLAGTGTGTGSVEPAPQVASASGSAQTLGLDDPDDLSVEPRVLMVPARPKPGETLPRGADELRRAVLGPEVSPSVEHRSERSPPRPAPAPESAPLPADLVAEIEDFKRSVQSGGVDTAVERTPAGRASSARDTGGGDGSRPQTTAMAQSARADGERPPALTSALRRQLPPFSMTVHVYDANPKRSFVYLNGSKVRPGELTRDGFFVEQVVADGAIIRYDDHRFFQSP